MISTTLSSSSDPCFSIPLICCWFPIVYLFILVTVLFGSFLCFLLLCWSSQWVCSFFSWVQLTFLWSLLWNLYLARFHLVLFMRFCLVLSFRMYLFVSSFFFLSSYTRFCVLGISSMPPGLKRGTLCWMYLVGPMGTIPFGYYSQMLRWYRWVACVYPLFWLGHDCCGCDPRLTGWQVWPQMVHMSWCSGLALSRSWLEGHCVPSSAIFQAGWGSLWSCSCFVGVLVSGTDLTGGIRWEPLGGASWGEQTGWVCFSEEHQVLARLTGNGQKTRANTRTTRWRSLILGKRKKLCLLYSQRISLPDPAL